MRIESSSSLRHCALISSTLALMALASCASVDKTSEVRDASPCPLTLAIADFTPLPPVPEGSEGLYMTLDAENLRDLLVSSLQGLRTASQVVLLSELGGDETKADVILTPTLREAVEFDHEGLAESWWASGGLWLVTWIGGMAVDDSTYNTNMALECSIRNPRSGRSLEQTAVSAPVDCTFLERNSFFSWPTLQAVIMPPFLTSDQEESTREALTSRAVDSVAVELANYFKRSYENDALRTDAFSLRLESPLNGGRIESESVRVQGRITCESAVTSIVVLVNGVQQKVVNPENDSSETGSVARLDFSAENLRVGTNFIRLLITAGDEYGRTLVLDRTR